MTSIFEGHPLQNKAFFQSKQGHLSSRYTYVDEVIFSVFHSHYFRFTARGGGVEIEMNFRNQETLVTKMRLRDMIFSW